MEEDETASMKQEQQSIKREHLKIKKMIKSDFMEIKRAVLKLKSF